MAAGKAVKGKPEADLHDLVVMGRAAVESVQQRGKAKLGDKTMLDALVPAIDALEDAEKDGLTLSKALANAAEAANNAVEDTASLKAIIGRAGWFSDRTQGHKDPGAAAIAELIKSLSSSVPE
jgi:phosphoenolpyruvate---glycerone phosphotransferase subunit DhaL